MPDQRIATIEMFIESWNRRDPAPMIEMARDDFEYVNPPNAVEPGVRRGSEGIQDVMAKQWEALGDARQDIDRVHVLGDFLVSEGRLSRTLPGSTSRLENKVALGWTFDGDRLVRLEVLGAGSSYHDALEEAGVGESESA
jgi:ketosteroid isomerase-like protein